MRRCYIAGVVALLLAGATTGCESPFYTGPDWDIETVYLPAVYVTGETPDDCCDHRVEWVSSDPRLSGRVTTRVNERVFPSNPEGGFGAPPVARVRAKRYTVVNDDGRWVGTSTGLELGAPDDATTMDTVVLSGEGDYEGFTAYLHVWEGEDCEDPCPMFNGLLFPGPMPSP